MKFTLLIRSKRIRFAKHIGARTLVSSIVLASILMLISSRSTEDIQESLARVGVIKTGLIAEQQKVGIVEQRTTDEIRVLMTQIASMEARLREIEVLSQHVAEQAGIDYPNVKQVLQVSSQEDLQNSTKVMDHPLVSSLQGLDKQLADKVNQLQALESVLLGHHIQDISEVAGRPIQKGWLSSYYGVREDPFTGKPTMHKGLDFAGKDGDPVIATAAGLVTWSGERYGYGNLVEIDHGNGLVSRYGHNAILDVKMGDVVTKGQVIASMGSTGRSTGAHVHYEVLRNGKKIDPLPFVY